MTSRPARSCCGTTRCGLSEARYDRASIASSDGGITGLLRTLGIALSEISWYIACGVFVMYVSGHCNSSATCPCVGCGAVFRPWVTARYCCCQNGTITLLRRRIYAAKIEVIDCVKNRVGRLVQVDGVRFTDGHGDDVWFGTGWPARLLQLLRDAQSTGTGARSRTGNHDTGRVLNVPKPCAHVSSTGTGSVYTLCDKIVHIERLCSRTRATRSRHWHAGPPAATPGPRR